MKPRIKNQRGLTGRSPNLLGLCTITFSLLTAGSALAQTSTWDGGGGDSNWNTGDNWSSNTAPTGGILNFFGTTQTAPVNNLTAGTAFTGITLTNNGTTGQSAGFSLSGNAITLGGNITTTTPLTGATAPENGVAMSATISLDLNLSSNSIFTAARNGTTLTGHNLSVSGLISETGGPFSLTKAGNANLTLSNTGNSFSGAFNITGNNDVTVGSIQPAGTNSSIGKGSVINMSTSNGFLIVNGNVATAGDINRTINLTNTGSATYRFQNDNATAANSLAFVSAITNSSTSGTTTFTLAGSNTGANEFRTAIVNGSGTNTTALSKINGGRWILSGDNTYKGATTITAGVLNIRHANALGVISGTSSVANLGQLQLEGGISYAAEPLSIAAGTGGVAQLLNVTGDNTWNGAISTTGVGNVVRVQSDTGLLTLAGGISVSDAGTQFVLQGNGNITMGGAISGPGRVSSSVTGTGVRTLAVANSYTGNTTVTGGVLRLNDANSIPGGIGTTGGVANINMTGGILGLGNGNLTRSLGTGVDQIQLSLNLSGFAAYGADRSVNFGGASAAIAFGDPGFFFGVTGNPSLVLSAPTATHTLDFQNPVVLAGTRFFRVDNGSAAVDARLSGAITGSTSFSKAGAGTLELTNTLNAWTNTTFIDSGSLRLGAADVLPSTTVEIKRAAGTDSPPNLDLNGFSETIGALTLGALTTDASNVGQTVSIVNNGGGTPVLTLTGTFLYRAGSVGFENGQATISANMNTGASNRNLTIGDGSAPVDVLISGVLSGTGSGFNKAGAGVLVISGANTYTGPTSIGAGTLRLGAVNTLPDASAISINAGTLDVSTFTDTAGTLDANAAGATINLGTGGAIAFAASSAVDWTGGTLNITGAFVPGASIRFGTTDAGLTALQLSQISINGTPGVALDPSGYLIVGSDPFLAWSGGAPFSGDANNDGVGNGLAWLLGAANKDVNALNLLPVPSQSGGGLQMSFSMLSAANRGTAVLELQHSSDLGISDLWTSVVVPNTSGGPTSGVTFTVTPGSPLNNVQVTISSSEAAGGKLFSRLKGVN